MTEQERASLPSLVDQVVMLETAQGEHLVVQVLFVFDEGETPDLFGIEVIPGAKGGWLRKSDAGHSILLDDIVRVMPVIAAPGESHQ
ncbi:hypothetical protein [Edaphobacter sp. 12200R-103]|uniref:hypothetical protein n=1 Tax=Edaphobacter sp. 12200R-103 TaxID=2703788 RepID=UPI00138CC55F|nr:hypothetical protein [Edaphobacter sp. 12200R-103]QHS52090.1 hypothetical protein GWR55_10330 [Edaphobacter sp. 12200R-103]